MKDNVQKWASRWKKRHVEMREIVDRAFEQSARTGDPLQINMMDVIRLRELLGRN